MARDTARDTDCSGGLHARIAIRMLNGLPALAIDFGPGKAGYPPRGVVRVDLDDDGFVRSVHSVLTTRKLTAVRFG